MAAWDSKLPLLQENCTLPRNAGKDLWLPTPAPRLDAPALIRSFHLQQLKNNFNQHQNKISPLFDLETASGSMGAHGNYSLPAEASGGGRSSLAMASAEASRSPAFVDSHTVAGPFPPPSNISAALESKKGSRKRSRVSRRPPTTILEADSSNFRAMVQHLTGIPPPFFSSPLQRRRFLQLSSNLPRPPPPVGFPRHSSGSSTLDPPSETLPSSFLSRESSVSEQSHPDHQMTSATKFHTVSEDSTNHTDPLSVFQSLEYSDMTSLLSSHDESPYLRADEAQFWSSRADLTPN